MTKLSGWLRHWCLANALKKRSNKGMKLPLLIELSQQQMQRNLTTSFFEGRPPPITVHGEGAKNVADGTTRQLKPGEGTPFEPVAGGEADSQAFYHKQHQNKVSRTYQKSPESGTQKNKTNLTQFQSKCILGKDWATSYKFKPFATSKTSKIFHKNLGVCHKRSLGTQCYFGGIKFVLQIHHIKIPSHQ